MKSILSCPLCPQDAPRLASVPLEEPSKKKRKKKSKDSATTTNVVVDPLLAINEENSLSAAIDFVEGLDSDLGRYGAQDIATPSTSTQPNQLALKDHITDLQCGDWIVYQSPVSIFLELTNHIELNFALYAVF